MTGVKPPQTATQQTLPKSDAPAPPKRASEAPPPVQANCHPVRRTCQEEPTFNNSKAKPTELPQRDMSTRRLLREDQKSTLPSPSQRQNRFDLASHKCSQTRMCSVSCHFAPAQCSTPLPERNNNVILAEGCRPTSVRRREKMSAVSASSPTETTKCVLSKALMSSTRDEPITRTPSSIRQDKLVT